MFILSSSLLTTASQAAVACREFFIEMKEIEFALEALLLDKEKEKENWQQPKRLAHKKKLLSNMAHNPHKLNLKWPKKNSLR